MRAATSFCTAGPSLPSSAGQAALVSWGAACGILALGPRPLLTRPGCVALSQVLTTSVPHHGPSGWRRTMGLTSPSGWEMLAVGDAAIVGPF